MNILRKTAFALVLMLAASPLAAQTNIDPIHKAAWGENVGWVIGRVSETPRRGLWLTETILSGFAWAENVGWIYFGDGDPGPVGGDDAHYANVDANDFGVNRDPDTGLLFGMAWGENIGWINFDGGALANPPAPMGTNQPDCRLVGYAWAENVGWINFDHAAQYIGYVGVDCCPADLDPNGVVDITDLAILLTIFGLPENARPDEGDLDRDGDVDLTDLASLLLVYGGACP